VSIGDRLLLGLSLALLVAAAASELRAPGSFRLGALSAVAASAVTASSAILGLLEGRSDALVGAALSGLALLYLLPTLTARRAEHRALRTALGASAIGLLMLALAAMLQGVELVVALTLVCALLASLAERTHEPRLQLVAGLALAVTYGYALLEVAPPSTLVRGQADVGEALSMLSCALAAFALLRSATLDNARDGDLLDYQLAELQWRLRLLLPWLIGITLAYALAQAALAGAAALLGGELVAPQRLGIAACSFLFAYLASDLYRRLLERSVEWGEPIGE
jgi:hypothetical protein